MSPRSLSLSSSSKLIYIHKKLNLMLSKVPSSLLENSHDHFSSSFPSWFSSPLNKHSIRTTTTLVDFRLHLACPTPTSRIVLIVLLSVLVITFLFFLCVAATDDEGTHWTSEFHPMIILFIGQNIFEVTWYFSFLLSYLLLRPERRTVKDIRFVWNVTSWT